MLNFSFNVILLVLLIILPGAIFRRAYNSTKLSNYHSRSSTFSEIVFTIGVGTLFQVLGIFIVNKSNYVSCAVDLVVLGKIVTSPTILEFQNVSNHIGKILCYNIVVSLISFITAKTLQFIIIRYDWDERFEFLKFENEWFYILTGKLHYVDSNTSAAKYVNVLVAIEENFIIYSGILTGYTEIDGKIELLRIVGVKRKLIPHIGEGNNEIAAKEYKMNVDELYVPYSKILNFSITHYQIEKIEESEIS